MSWDVSWLMRTERRAVEPFLSPSLPTRRTTFWILKLHNFLGLNKELMLFVSDSEELDADRQESAFKELLEVVTCAVAKLNLE